MKRLRRDSIERVVVRGANWVGDAVMTVPALRELRRFLPGAHITLATRAWAEGIFEGADFLDDIVAVEETKGTARSVWRESRAWRARRFDLAVLFPNAFAPALVAALARVPVRVGYATQGRGALLTHALPVPDWRGLRHEVFYYLNIVAELEGMLVGSTTVESREPQTEINVSDERRKAAREFLRGRGARDERPLVALCPGSTNSRAKRWPAERFAALADALVEKLGADVALVGACDELDVSEEVARRMRARPLVLTGETELSQTVALLSVADLLVTNDTGPAHVAAAAGCPVVVIFGPTNPVTTRPFSPLAEVVREPPDCAPCMLRDCPIDHRCMTAITVETVFKRAAHALEARVASPASQGKLEVAR
ncbi:MAG TPA: lipopolysaccharide heptosyltransferase II [Pyrinomonadaceae bacterium]|jgi:heptosyltransferase-2|nr:lipopolysaccharide heptosyltransferase II [Pyrinomonadaceae bacterium]